MTPRTSLLAFALLLLACHAPATTPAPAQRGDACTDLAYVSHLIADARDRGATKEAQIERVRESVLAECVVDERGRAVMSWARR